jgi:hypothetical protein
MPVAIAMLVDANKVNLLIIKTRANAITLVIDPNSRRLNLA